jgi:hypothetical protein
MSDHRTGWHLTFAVLGIVLALIVGRTFGEKGPKPDA